jgi:hypothetical protein
MNSPSNLPKLYQCNVCQKKFKTTQHLEQHINKKKPCSSSDSSSVSSNSSTSNSSISNLSNDEMINFIQMYSNIQSLMKEKKLIDEYKQQILTLQEENNKLKYQISLINKISNNILQFDERNKIINEPNELNDSCELSNSNKESLLFQINNADLYDEDYNKKSPSNETFTSNISSLTEDQINDPSSYIWKSAPFNLS